jgi:DNA mismatch endonuclease, patch repair protein
MTTAARSRIMKAIKPKDTRPEVAVRKALHAKGYRFRLHSKNLPGKPDIVLARFGAVIEVRGCFWHGHKCQNGRVPLANVGFWTAKLSRNKERDARNIRALRKMGYRVAEVWECQVATPAQLLKTVRRLTNWLCKLEELRTKEAAAKAARREPGTAKNPR